MTLPFSPRFTSSAWVKWLAVLLLPVAAGVMVLLTPAPRQIGLSVRYGFISVLLPAFILLFFTTARHSWGWYTASMALAVMLFAFPLSGLWMSGAGEKTIIAGLLPWSDANAYYDGARGLLESELLDGIAARRPMFAAYLASLIGLSGYNLQASLAVMMLISALACWLAALQVQRTHGTLAAVLFFLFLFLFYRRFSGTTMTENLGLPLGALGFALLWRGTESKSAEYHLTGFYRRLFHSLADHKYITGGVFLLTLALNARAGAFLILPLLVLWAGCACKNSNSQGFFKNFKFSAALWVSAAILLGFLANILFVKLLTHPDSQPFSNFSYTLYGLAVGGKGWQQILVDHPEFRFLNDEEFNRRTYALALQAIRHNPLGLVSGSINYWSDFISLKSISAYGFITTDTPIVTQVVRISLYLLAAAGIIYGFINRRLAHASMILVAVLGILLSVPFAPPIDAEEMRAFAATMPFFALLPVLGLVLLIQRLPRLAWLALPQPHSFPGLLPAFSCALVVFLAAGLLAVKVSGKPTPHKEVTCPADQTAIYVRLTPGSYLNILEDSSSGDLTHLPDIEWSRYRKSVHDSMNSRLVPEFIDFKPPALVMNAYDLKAQQQLWLFIDARLVPQGAPAVASVCGHWGNYKTGDWMIPSFFATLLADASIR